jgi:hypothetical protein
MLSQVFYQSADGVSVVPRYAFYGADSVSLDEEFAYFGDFLLGEVFVVEGGEFGFCEGLVAVEAFVDLVFGVVFSSLDYMFSFFLEEVFASEILAADRRKTLDGKDFVWLIQANGHVDLKFFMGSGLDSDLLRTRGIAEKRESVRHVEIRNFEKLQT